jgi:hypothetical protein
VRQLHDFYYLTRDGLQQIIEHHEFIIRGDERIKLLTVELETHGGSPRRDEAEEAQRHDDREQARKRAELALQEVSMGFPVLHSQQVVFLWGAVEAAVEDTLAAWLANEKLLGKDHKLRKIKVSLADFNMMNVTERYYHLIAELRRELRTSHRSSMEVFESMLHQFGLSGPMGPHVKKSLIELEHVRNILLHRRGIADSRFLQACPWMPIAVGSTVVPDEESVMKYVGAVLDYYELLLGRINQYFESRPSEFDASLQP